MEATENIDVEFIPGTLQGAIVFYADQDNCLDILVALRWPDGVVCPHCDGTDVTFMKSRRVWQCKVKECRKQFSIKVGTIFEDSPLGLDKWLSALWMISNCKNGISSYEIHRALGITQKSAWFLLHRIRLAMKEGTFERLEGTVEADETFIGGKAKNMHKAEREKKIQGCGAVGKEIVMGVLERADGTRASRVRAKVVKVVKDTSKETLHAEIKANVVEGSEVFTDAHGGYRGLSEEYKHDYVDHAIKYVEGKVHTNGLENFWNLTKRMLPGTYVSVEPEHLLAYLDEESFRYIERLKNDRGRFLTTASGITGKRLMYKTLIGDPQGIDSPDPLRGGPRAD